MKRKLSGFVPTGIVILVITLVGTLVHGNFSNRWHQADETRVVAGKMLEELGGNFGNWALLREVPFERNETVILRYTGMINRVYVNQITRETVALAVIVGPPGPTSTHTAALCYSSNGYDLAADVKLVNLEMDGKTHEIARALFHPKSPGLQSLEVCYAWRQLNEWRVPAIPRVAFGGGDYLFKFQVAANLFEDKDFGDDNNADEGQSLCLEFLKEFLPAMESQVFQRLENEAS